MTCCLRFLNEDPWERLRKIRAKMPNTKLQMLLRGQNILGYKHYSDDVVRRFVRAAVKNGIDIIRIFDALNDMDNLKVAIEETVKSGAMASGAISYTTSPVHTLDKYVEMVKEMQRMGVGSICIKDMAGILSPKSAYDLVSAIKDAVDLPLVLHTHCTTGLAFMTYLKAIEAGADVIDTAISPFSGGTSQPATETYELCSAGAGLRHRAQGGRALRHGRLLQAHSGGVPCRRHTQPHLHGYRHSVPQLPDTRRHALQPSQPAEDDERPGQVSTRLCWRPPRYARTWAILPWSLLPASW